MGSPPQTEGTSIAKFRELALSFPEAEESPHFDLSSFRVRGKIFATVPPGDEFAHVFVDDDEAMAAVHRLPDAYSDLWWGKKRSGVRAKLAVTPLDDLADLVEEAWRRKAPKRVVVAFDTRRTRPDGTTA